MKQTTIWVAAALTLAAGCKNSEPSGAPAAGAKPTEAAVEAPTPTPAAPKPADPKPAADPMAVFQASGDQLATGDNPGTNPLAWHGVVLAAVVRGDDAVLRVYGSAGAADLGKPIANGDLLDTLEPVDGGASVRFRSHTLSGRAPEVGAMLAYDDAHIEWDATAGAPVVRDTWSCDETTAKGGTCAGPAWAGDDAATTSTAPSPVDAAMAVKQWLAAIAGGHLDQATGFLTDQFQVYLTQSAGACPQSGPISTKTRAELGKAVQCVSDLLVDDVKSLASRASVKGASATWPEDYDPASYDIQALAATGPAGSITYVTVANNMSAVVALVTMTPDGARIAGVFVYNAPGD